MTELEQLRKENAQLKQELQLSRLQAAVTDLALPPLPEIGNLIPVEMRRDIHNMMERYANEAVNAAQQIARTQALIPVAHVGYTKGFHEDGLDAHIIDIDKVHDGMLLFGVPVVTRQLAQ